MKQFFIITNQDKDTDLVVTRELTRLLDKKGASYGTYASQKRHEGKWHYVDPAVIPKETQCLIVLGGDGTLLQVARDVVELALPLLGINLGHLGFLAGVEKAGIPWAMEKLLADDFDLEERMMLRGRVIREGRVIGEDLALNDIVITREGRIRVIPFINYVNGEFLTSFNADGIILATATGSTGYTLSAGGPIVSPSAQLAIMTALAPHTLNMRSVIFPPQDVITVEVGKGRHGSAETCVVSFDGDMEIRLVSGDKIVIERASQSTRIVKLSRLSFVETLRIKLHTSQEEP